MGEFEGSDGQSHRFGRDSLKSTVVGSNPRILETIGKLQILQPIAIPSIAKKEV